MSAAAPWSVKGIDPRAREIAKDLARRSGLTLGDWLNRVIMEDSLAGVTDTGDQLQRQQVAADKARSTYQMSQYQFHAGTVNILTVLSTETALFSAQDALAQAQLAREIFPRAALKYMPPTKHMTGDVFKGHLIDAMFNLTSVMTGKSIHL